MKPLWIAVAAFAALVLAMSPVVAQQQPAGDGLFNAVAYKPLPGGATLYVRALNDSDRNLTVRQKLIAALENAGYAVSPEGEFVVSFDTSGDVGAFTANDRRHIVEFYGRDATSDDETTRARLNIFDSQSGGLVNEGTSDRTQIVTPSKYRLEVTIDARSGTERRLWQAWAVAELRQSNPETLVGAMVPVIVRHIGETVRREPFEVR